MIGYILHFLMYWKIFSFVTALFQNKRIIKNLTTNSEIALPDLWVGTIKLNYENSKHISGIKNSWCITPKHSWRIFNIKIKSHFKNLK